MPDYMFLLESRLLPEQRAALLRVQELSAALGYNVYLTGGTVRDLITGASLRDLDFTVEGNPSKIARELEKGGAKVLVEDEKLRHVEILFAGRSLRAAGYKAGIPLVNHHGGSAAARFVVECNRNFSESCVTWFVARSDERAFRH